MRLRERDAGGRESERDGETWWLGIHIIHVTLDVMIVEKMISLVGNTFNY